MKFHPTPLHGAYTIELEKRGDDRGFFARFFCQKEFEAAGVPIPIVQINNSLSAKAGTLRGMHYQLAPAAEIKVVRCIRGALYDAIVDLRPDSPTFGKWFGVELTAENRLMIYVPQGFAHGIMTLTDDTEALYLVNAFYSPEQERGLRFDDPRFGIEWPRAARRSFAQGQQVAGLRPCIPRHRMPAGPDVRILLTGGSSFTGLWFARSLAARGHTVVAPLRGSDYSGLRGSRVAELRRVAEIIEDCPFGSDRFLDLAGTGSWDLLCQHAAQTGDYRNPDFDVVGAVADNTKNLVAVLKKMMAAAWQASCSPARCSSRTKAQATRRSGLSRPTDCRKASPGNISLPERDPAFQSREVRDREPHRTVRGAAVLQLFDTFLVQGRSSGGTDTSVCARQHPC